MIFKKIKYRSLVFWVLQISGWSAYGMIDTFIRYVDGVRNPKNILGAILTYTAGIIVTYLLRLFYKRFDISTKGILFTSFYIVLLSVPAGLLWIYIDLIISIPLWGFKTLLDGYIATPAIEKFSGSFFNSLIIMAWSGLYFGIKYSLEWNIQKEQIEKTELLLERAQLKLLRYQLNPHFLFNSLSSLRMLIRKDAKRAEQMLNKIAEFLRYSISGMNNQEVPLGKELKAIQHYFEIEKIRFEEKLDIRYNIDPLAEDFPVPIFLIHPLIENAIKFGMDTSEGKLQIEINAKVKEQTLNITVSNSGKWINPAQHKNGTGTGLRNIRKRLEIAFPDQHTFEIIKSDGKVSAILELTRELEND